MRARMQSPVESALVFPLETIRTDGWFERVGAEIDNFATLCELVGPRVFAFSMILGVRITALSVDPEDRDETTVEFLVEADRLASLTPERLPLREFRRRLIAALLSAEPSPSLPHGPEDWEGLRQHIGVPFLLIAPLYGYSLHELVLENGETRLSWIRQGQVESGPLRIFHAALRTHLHEELDLGHPEPQDAIDLSHVALAIDAAAVADWERVVVLLQSWPAPLAFYLRTPEGQALPYDVRALVGKGLGLLGTAYVRLGDARQGEDIFRLALQFASEGEAAAEIFHRLGEAMLETSRPGEAIGPLRRALRLGAPATTILPLLAQAFEGRERHVAAWVCLDEAEKAGAPEEALAAVRASIEGALGARLEALRAHLRAANS